MVESPRPATIATVPTNGIGPLEAIRPNRWYTAERSNNSVRVCSVAAEGDPEAVRRPPHPEAATARPSARTHRLLWRYIGTSFMGERSARVSCGSHLPGRVKRLL